VAVNTAVQTFLRKKRGTHDLSVMIGLVLHVMVGVIGHRKTRVIADFAEWHVSRTDPTVGKFAIRNRNRSSSTA
jgi:hypothetical protein